jgi:hypothetical protein
MGARPAVRAPIPLNQTPIMPTSTPSRPAAGEFFEYYGKYIALVPDGDVRGHIEHQLSDTVAFIKSRPESWAMSRYAPGKWSVKEVIGHLADAERIFAYRALRIARGDTTALAGFDENAYVPVGKFDARETQELLEEYAATRAATIAMFRGFDDAAWARTGNASGHTISVRALAYIIAGHERHHLSILRDRYS